MEFNVERIAFRKNNLLRTCLFRGGNCRAIQFIVKCKFLTGSIPREKFVTAGIDDQ